MKKSLENIQKIKKLAKIKAIINIIAIPVTIVVAIIMMITTLHSLSTKTPLGSSVALYIFAVILSLFLSITNLVLAILLIVNSTSIYIPAKDSDDEIKEEIKTFKTTALVLSILSIFFGLILDIIIWVMSNTKIRFLKEKIEEQKEQEETKVV